MSAVSYPARPLFEGRYLRATGYGHDAPRIVLTFDFFDSKRRGFRDLVPTRDAPGPDAGTISINTSHNDWFLNPDLGPLLEELEFVLAGKTEVVAVGFSMGGYGALLVSGALSVRRVLLVSPQISIFPEHAPWETRHLKEAALLDPEADDLASCVPPGLEGVILFDPRHMMDRMHARAISDLTPGLRRVALPFGAHPATKKVIGLPGFWALRTQLLNGGLTPRAARAQHKARRTGSEVYQAKLQAYLAERAARSE